MKDQKKSILEMADKTRGIPELGKGGPPMTREEAIKQLENLYDHCQSMISGDDGFPVWEDDCKALKIALTTLTPPNEAEYREYVCPSCHHMWLEDRDATDYPEYCPGCGEPLSQAPNEPLTIEQVLEMQPQIPGQTAMEESGLNVLRLEREDAE